jgi:hypothetical protein
MLHSHNTYNSNSYNLDVSKDVIPPPLDIGSPADDFEKQWAYNNNNNNNNNSNNSNSVTAGSSSVARNSSSATGQRREVCKHYYCISHHILISHIHLVTEIAAHSLLQLSR